MSPRLDSVQCLGTRGLHRMAYWEWGERTNPHVVVCVHGLTRQGRDFDALARDLAGERRVVCVDVVGRGRSERLADPAGYVVPQYVADVVTLLARLDAGTVDWVGTSMGGLIGIGVASLANSPIRRLVLNDVGPAIDPAGLERIKGYVGQPARWKTVEEAAEQIRRISLGFGPHSAEQWLELTRPQLVADGDGYVPHYDPALALPFRNVTPEMVAAGEAGLWAAYDSLRCPTLLLRGADSDLLSPATAEAMTRRGPHARLVEFAGVGHAPMLVQPDQRAVVRDFLLAP